MKILVMGTGGIGGYFGGRLAAVGQAVTFVARGAHLEAIRRDGLQVLSPNGNITVKPAKAVSDPAAGQNHLRSSYSRQSSATLSKRRKH